MEMEVSSELGKDSGSDDGDRGSDRSSAASEFCALEEGYAKVLEEMRGNEALAAYQTEYSKLFEALYSAHRNEKRLVNECQEFRDEIDKHDEKLQAAQNQIDADNIQIAKLKREIESALKLADAAHTREQQAQQMIDTLRMTTVKLNEEIEQKNKQLGMEEENATASKQRESLSKERDRMISEIEALRQRVAHLSSYKDELEKTNSQVDQKMIELQNTVETQTNEFSKERRAREEADRELAQAKEELKLLSTELQETNAKLKATTNHLAKLENTAREQKSANESLQKQIDKCMLKRLNAQTELDNLTSQLEGAHKEMMENAKKLKNLGVDNTRLKNEIDKLVSQNETALKKNYKAEVDRNKAEEELRKLRIAMQSMELDVQDMNKKLEGHTRTIETLHREHDAQARTITLLKSTNKKQDSSLQFNEKTKSKLLTQIENLTMDNQNLKRAGQNLEKERNKYMSEVQELVQRIDDQMNEVKMKQMEISDFKKRLAEAETKFRQQQNVFETVRADRNTCSKQLVETQEEVAELKQTIKVMNNQIDQLKEEVEMKEKSLIKGEFLLGKAEKEKDTIKIHLQNAQKGITDLRHDIEERKTNEKQLRKSFQSAEVEINRQKKEIEMIMNEKDILGTQLVRRNDELSLQYDRSKIFQNTINTGKSEYVQRLEDIRLLKLEVKKLRTEKVLLAKSISNMSDLRQEILHLDRDLIREKLKVMALEQEIQNPLNIHRWRKLEGSDPETYELLLKIQILQRRILKMCASTIEKEKKIREGEKLYMNLRAVVSKQPGPEVIVSLQATRKALRQRGNKIKCLIAELNASESETNEYKFNLQRLTNEMCMVKSKYYQEKRKNQKNRESRPKDLRQTTLPLVQSARKKFCGGGFNMTIPMLRDSLGFPSESGNINV